MLNIDDDDVSLIDSAIRHNVGKDEIRLFEQMSLALNLMNTNDDFRVVHKYVRNGDVFF